MIANRIGIHVVGPSYGEAVVLELPDGAIGVVDCFSDYQREPPILTFLRRRFPDTARLYFLALTHPHADHTLGASCLAEEFGLDEFWVFQPFPAGHLQYYDALVRAKTPDGMEELLGLPAGCMSLELERLAHRFRTQHSKSRKRYLQCHSSPLELCNNGVKVHRLTPDDGSTFAYEQQLESAEKAAVGTSPGQRRPSVDHNLASGALLVQFGKTRILLMADAERELWHNWLTGSPNAASEPVDFIKASHHGSTNGYLDKLYCRMANAERTLAVITPFFKGAVRLPTAEGVRCLANHVRELFCTNRTVAQKATGLVWEEVINQRGGPTLPVSWVIDCRKNSDLLQLLDPSVGGIRVPADRPELPIPTKWLSDCQRRSDLVRAIRPEYRHLMVSASGPHVDEEFRFTVYFDDQGHELDREIGAGVGRMAMSRNAAPAAAQTRPPAQ